MPVIERQPYVQVAEVSKIYRSGTPNAVEAVSSVSFSVPHGQFVAILGPSGCGKSTLLMMVGGLESVTAGHIAVDGSAMAGPRTSIGVMFQDSTLLPWKSALDNVLFPIRILKRPLDAYRDSARQLLERVGLDDFANKKPHELSGGMRQRVAICRALVYDPELLLMDEPFSALDAITRDDMNIVLLELWERYRKTVLFVTHSLNEAVYLADRVIVLSARPGRIVDDVAVDLPRPRTFSMTSSERFGVLKERIWQHIRRAERP